MNADISDKCEILSDGKSVWVNNAFGCIARFGRGGIDIHYLDSIGATGCLDCTHGLPTREHWDRFVQGCLNFHDVTVPQHHMPDWLKEN